MDMTQLKKVIEVVWALRDPQSGCPWDLEQTHQSLLPFLLEESYEFKDALCAVHPNWDHIREELGDILLQVLLHSTIAEQENHFTLEEVAQTLAEKLINRHPHVFGETSLDSIAEIEAQWEEIKKEENKHKEKEGRLKKKLLFAPALSSAYKIGKKTAKLKFDWDDPMQVAYKVEEEWQELKEELAQGQLGNQSPSTNHDRIAEEMGDVLFSMAQLARHLGCDPEELLHKANQKFLRRFSLMEKLIEQEGIDLEGLNQEQMDHYWDRVKHEFEAHL